MVFPCGLVAYTVTFKHTKAVISAVMVQASVKMAGLAAIYVLRALSGGVAVKLRLAEAGARGSNRSPGVPPARN